MQYSLLWYQNNGIFSNIENNFCRNIVVRDVFSFYDSEAYIIVYQLLWLGSLREIIAQLEKEDTFANSINRMIHKKIDDIRLSYTPFHIACLTGRNDIIKYMIDNGGDLNNENFEGLTPFLILCMKGDKEIIYYACSKDIDDNASIDSKSWKEIIFERSIKLNL